MLDMVEEGDLEFLKSAISNKSYSFLDKIRFNEYVDSQRSVSFLVKVK